MKFAFAKKDLQNLIDALVERGYRVVGPQMGEGAIVYDELTSVEELPRGWVEKQEAAIYRLERDPEDRFFAFTNVPQSWKKFLHPPNLCLLKARKEGQSFSVDDSDEVVPTAFFGVRACELAAIRVQDGVFLGQQFKDPWYDRRREAAFLIGVNCARAGGTCFCVSMKTGPAIENGDDLTLTELKDVFLAEPRNSKAEEILKSVSCREATAEELAEAGLQAEETAKQMGRELDTDGLPELIMRNYDEEHWEEVAQKCMACTNCTMVCPTCFCFTVEEVTDLTGQESSRVRSWDSCFTTDFTFTAGSPQRTTTLSRYRQWMTHKLSTWHEQFGESGCVGCGRCITWCPVGIDITAQAASLRAQDGGSV